ncbi:hypothetical protein SEUCBS140593_003407 [Sporothrix eucalyptigena]|uniref:Rhodopsin domain-containing protein n=1 Tax=Sporothrix eucalyptigena TaxID=1812306 RepID=A0ABP0BEV2_9PEZI
MAARDVYYPLIITFLVLNSTVVLLRLYTRFYFKSFGWDDALMLVALIGFIIFGAMELNAVHYGIGATNEEPWFNAIEAAKYFTIAQLLYIIASGITKLAVALVLHRLTSRASDGNGSNNMRFARIGLLCTMGVTIVFTIVVTLIFALQCRPLSVAWGVGTGTCINTNVIGQAALALSIEDVLTSWFMALLPVYMLWQTNIPTKVKVSVMVLLGMGAVSSVATIIRLKYVIEVQNMSSTGGLAAAQVIDTTLIATIYSILEIALSIFAASLSALRPLMRRIGIFSDLSTGRSGNSKSGNSHPLRTFGQSSGRVMNSMGISNNSGAIQLDASDADSDSQRGIFADRWASKPSLSAA